MSFLCQLQLICIPCLFKKLEKKYAPTVHNYGQSRFVRSDFLKMKCVCKTQMMPRLTIRNYKQVKNCSRSHTNHVSIM